MNAALDVVLGHVLDWVGTYALHSCIALGAALLIGAVLRDRAVAWQERLLRFAMWAAVASATLQVFVLGGPWRGGLPGFAAEPPALDALFVLPAADAAAPPSVLGTAGDAPIPWRTWLGLAVLGAGAVGLAGWWRCRRRLVRLLATRRDERGANVLAIARSLARDLGLRAVPRIGRSAALATPVAFGIRRPEVVLPGRVDELDAASLRAMLAHEFAHVRRRDPTMLALAALLQALFPWQVLLPVVRRRWLALAELRCDAIAVQRTSPTAVARCLLEVASWLQARPAAPPLALAMASRASALRDRIEAALQPRAFAAHRRRWSWATGGASLSLLTGLAPGFATAPPAPARPAEVALLRAAPSPAGSLLAEHAALVAEARALQAELARGPASPELGQLLVALQRRLLVVERLASRISERVAAASPKAVERREE